jgi:large conductance mechanosensitive channel
MLNDFKKFLLRGNVVDLAVAVAVGAAFGLVITALVKDVFTPLIAAVVGKPDFSTLSITINHSKILYGDFINALIAFVSIATVIFFFVVQPINKLQTLATKNKAVEDPSTKDCPYCLSSVPVKAKRCMYCTSNLK